jgi:3-oxoadipate enol-lactonase
LRNSGKELNVKINDIFVFYRDVGPIDAPVIVFIHGFPLNKSMWVSQIEAMKDSYRLISYDIRGHGNSSIGTEEFSIDRFADDLLSFLDAMKINKSVLCGLSMGGYIALNAVTNFKERFDGLVLCDTNCLADTQEAIEKRLQTIENIENSGIEKYADESIEMLFSGESLITKLDEIAEVKKMILNTPLQTLTQTLLALTKRKETAGKLKEISLPVLIIVGKEDVITPVTDAQYMNANIEGSILTILENAGHLSNMENSDSYNKRLKNFVSKIYT